MKKCVIILLLNIIGFSLYSQTDIPLCYAMVWNDEFNDSSLDLTKWGYQNGGWNGSNVQNCYTPNNTTVSNGSLVITSEYEPGHNCFGNTTDFTSGFVQTKNLASWTYGYFEARVKLPSSNSTWPAFWMSPETNTYGSWPRSGEIDIFEIKGHDLSKSYGNAHWGNAGNDKRQQKGPYDVGNAASWHVYGVEWKLGELKFYIDGVHYHTINDFKEPNAGTHPQPFDIPFYIRLNMAVGGDYLEAPWNDADNGLAQLPATMEVDYVRVYQLDPACTSLDNCNIIQDGGFENGTTAWSLFTANGANGNLSLDNDGYSHIEITSPGTANWHLALRQTGLPLENGKTYEVSYVAFADAAKNCNVILNQSSGSPQYHFQSQTLTTCPTHYSFQFTMGQPTDLNAYINISLGATDIDAYFENISVREVNCLPCQYNYTILDQTVPVGSYQVENLILSNGFVQDPTTVSFHSNMIELTPDFETELGSIFEALIDPCSN